MNIKVKSIAGAAFLALALSVTSPYGIYSNPLSLFCWLLRKHKDARQH